MLWMHDGFWVWKLGITYSLSLYPLRSFSQDKWLLYNKIKSKKRKKKKMEKISPSLPLQISLPILFCRGILERMLHIKKKKKKICNWTGYILTFYCVESCTESSRKSYSFVQQIQQWDLLWLHTGNTVVDNPAMSLSFLGLNLQRYI